MPRACATEASDIGHRPDIRVDGEIGPVVGETAAGGERVEAAGPERVAAFGRAAGIVEIDQDHVEAGIGLGEKALRRIEHHGLLQVKPAARDRDDGLVGIDEGRRAIRQIGADEPPHRRAAHAEQQRIDRLPAHRQRQRHQPLVMEHQARRIEQIHARLLGHLRACAERAQGAEMPRAAVEIDDEDRGAKGLGAPQHANPRVAAEVIENQAALPLFAVIGDHRQAASRADGTASAKRRSARPPASASECRCRVRAGRTSHRRCAAECAPRAARPSRSRSAATRIGPTEASARAQRKASWR